MLVVVVQLVRTPDCDSGSCEFESRQSPFQIRTQYGKDIKNESSIVQK